jgi:hypothetical protein
VTPLPRGSVGRSTSAAGSTDQRASFLEECWRLAAPDHLEQRRVNRVNKARPVPQPPLAVPPGPALPQGGGVNENREKATTDLGLARWLPRWGEDSLYVYHERLGIAYDLEQDTVVGSAAEHIACHEARWVAAGLPAAWSDSREPAAAHGAFEPMGGLTFAGFEEGAP